jgi:uncharacterized membrane protein
MGARRRSKSNSYDFKGANMKETHKDTPEGKSDTMAEATMMGLHYGSRGLLIGIFLCNPVICIAAGAAGFALGMIVVLSESESNRRD